MKWSGRLDSNQRPLDPQSSALSQTALRPVNGLYLTRMFTAFYPNVINLSIKSERSSLSQKSFQIDSVFVIAIIEKLFLQYFLIIIC